MEGCSFLVAGVYPEPLGFSTQLLSIRKAMSAVVTLQCVGNGGAGDGSLPGYRVEEGFMEEVTFLLGLGT